MLIVEIGGTRINKFTTSLSTTVAYLPNPEIIIEEPAMTHYMSCMWLSNTKHPTILQSDCLCTNLIPVEKKGQPKKMNVTCSNQTVQLSLISFNG